MNWKNIIEESMIGTMEKFEKGKHYPVINRISKENTYDEELIEQISLNIKKYGYQKSDYKIHHNSFPLELNSFYCGQSKNVQWRSNNYNKQEFHPDIVVEEIKSNKAVCIIENKFIKGFFYNKSNWKRNSNCKYFYDNVSIFKTYDYIRSENYPKTNYDLTTFPIFDVFNEYKFGICDKDIFLTFFHEGQLWHDMTRLLSFKRYCTDKVDNNVYLYLSGYVQTINGSIDRNSFLNKLNLLTGLYKKLQEIHYYSLRTYYMIKGYNTVYSLCPNISFNVGEITVEENHSRSKKIQCIGYTVELKC